MRIATTGCSGYVGQWLVPELDARGHEVVGADREEPSGMPLSKFVHGDLNERVVAERLVADSDLVIHLAAAKGDWGIPDAEYFRDNMGVTRTLLEASVREGVKSHLFFSSVAAVGPRDHPPDESATLQPHGAYGWSKAWCEALYEDYAREHPDAEVMILRPSAIFGPEHPETTNVHRLIRAIRDRRFVMVGDGETKKSTSYIENVVSATLFLMDRMGTGLQTWCYVDEPVLTTGELVAVVHELIGRPPPRFHIPSGIAAPVARVSDWAAEMFGVDFPITSARIRKFNRSTNYDASRIREQGFEQPVENREALRRTVAWHVEHDV